jgi:GTP-binding protein LepA
LPNEHLGKIIKLCEDRRGKQVNINYITTDRVQLVYDLPLSEMVFDFYDHLKSLSKGYASMDYNFKEYRASDLVKLDILINAEKVDALSIICHRDTSYFKGRDLNK